MREIIVDGNTLRIDGKPYTLPLNDVDIKYFVCRNDCIGWVHIFTADQYGGRYYQCDILSDCLEIVKVISHNFDISSLSIVAHSTTSYKRSLDRHKYSFLFSGTGSNIRGIRLITINHPFLFNDDLASDLYESAYQKKESGPDTTIDEIDFDGRGCVFKLYNAKFNRNIDISLNQDLVKGSLIDTLDLTDRLVACGIDFNHTQAIQSKYTIYKF
jgi:hypothetical protein